MDASELINKLDLCGLAESEKAIEQLRSGVHFETIDALAEAGTNLEATYQVRLNNLNRKKGLYATRLAESINEFVCNLSAFKPDRLRIITIPAEDCGRFLLWLLPETNTVIGCLYTLSAEHRAYDYI